MAAGKTKIEAAAQSIAKILEKQMAKMPHAQAKGLLKDIHALAAKTSARQNASSRSGRARICANNVSSQV